MYYNEVLSLNDYFQPTYDLTNETIDYWKYFIPNDKFLNLITKTLNTIELREPSESKSIWMQGAYGTGKSHATAVIKHLLCADVFDIKDYINSNFEPQLKNRIIKIREKDKIKVFPVILKGTASIYDNWSFKLAIQKEVKRECKRNGISITTKNDFEEYIEKIKQNPLGINWQKNIIDNSELIFHVQNEQDLINKLEEGDTKILKLLETKFYENGYHIRNDNLTNWLIEVVEQLKNKNEASALMIYWDEFTSMLELQNSGLLLTELQNIAELSINKDIYLFIISHRSPLQTTIIKEDINKIYDRFKIIDYSMEPITTYHIMKSTIKKKNEAIWNNLKNKYIDKLEPLINRIIGSDSGIKIKDRLKDIFPIHPYTAYLATFIARNIGSTERSIFNFLYDEEHGFKSFIKNNPGNNDENIFLTADYLFDYFYEEFERKNISNEKFDSILERFKLRKSTLEEKGEEYIAIYKSIILLNLLHRIVELQESSLVTPNIDNIKSIYIGTKYEKYISVVLDYIEINQIINKTPDNLYLVATSTLPHKEVDEEKNRIENNYKDTITILSSEHKEKICNIFKNSVLRVTEVVIYDGSLSVYILRNKLDKDFKNSYSIHIAVFITKNTQEQEQIKITIRSLLHDENLNDIIFVILENFFNEELKSKFIEYSANANVAEKHNFKEDQITNENYAKKIIDEWISTTEKGYLLYFFKNEEGKNLVNNFNQKINIDLSKKIFKFGLENLFKCTLNTNVWTKKTAKSAIEIFLFATDRDDIDSKTTNNPYKYLREILKDNKGEYIVDLNLDFRENIDNNHPVRKMDVEINKVIETYKCKGIFNLSEALDFLNKPPFGLYANMIFMAAVGFLMRKYLDKLYKTDTGKPVSSQAMRDIIIELFKSWDNGMSKNNLEVRFGSIEEKGLINLLSEIFNLNNIESLNDLRWKIKEWCNEIGYPLWVFKHNSESNQNIKLAIDDICELLKTVCNEIIDSNIKEYYYKINNINIDLKNIINKSNAVSCFEQWLVNIENTKIQKTDIDDIHDYLKIKLSGEICYWEESAVRDKVKDWALEKLNNKITIKDNINVSNQIEPIQDINQFTKEEVKSQIEQCEDKIAKAILLKLLDEKPDIISYIEIYLKNIHLV